MGPSSVLLAPGTGAFPYTATVRVTDVFGTVAEALFAFADPSGAVPRPSASNFRPNFVNETPELRPLIGPGPDDWNIHHTLQQQKTLAKRYLDERVINVHENQYLRGVPRKVHNDLNAAQDSFWAREARENFNGNKELAYKNTPWSKIDDFVAKQEQEYAKWWLSAGEGKKISKIENRLAKMADFTMSRANRWGRLGLQAFTGFAIFNLISERGTALAAIADHSPAQLQKWREFEGDYLDKMKKGYAQGYLSKDDALLLKGSFMDYVTAMNLLNPTESVQLSTFLDKEIMARP